MSGGDATADVITEKLGPDRVAHKHFAGVKYEDIVVTCGADMSKSFYDWIAAALNLNSAYSPKDGATVIADSSGRVTARLEFMHALIHEITFPALDASSTTPGVFQVKLTPEYTRTDNKSSAIVKSSVSPETNWLVRNFRLQINGLDCTSVDSIDALTISIDQRADAVGDARDYAKEPTTLNIPNLSFTIPVVFARDQCTDSRPRRQGDRITTLFAALHESAFGTKRTSRPAQPMSAFDPTPRPKPQKVWGEQF